MLPLPRYRSWQLAAMDKNMLNIEHLVSNDPAVTKRDGDDGWNISEVLGQYRHLWRGRARWSRGLTRRKAPARAWTNGSKKPVTPEQDAMELETVAECQRCLPRLSGVLA